LFAETESESDAVPVLVEIVVEGLVLVADELQTFAKKNTFVF
jgi:hypothetical protein